MRDVHKDKVRENGGRAQYKGNQWDAGRTHRAKKRFSDVLNLFGGVVYQDRNDGRQSETIRKVRQNFCIFMSFV